MGKPKPRVFEWLFPSAVKSVLDEAGVGLAGVDYHADTTPDDHDGLVVCPDACTINRLFVPGGG